MERVIEHRVEHNRVWAKTERLAREDRKLGGRIAIEWPKTCMYWGYPRVKRLISELGIIKAECHGCAFGLHDSQGVPIKKPWYVYTDSPDMAAELNKYKCPGCPKHSPCEGKTTTHFGKYVINMGKAIHRAWAKCERACGYAAAAS